MITVYVDVLVSLNILLTYLFLVCTRVFLKTPTSKTGIAFASLLGGLSSLIIYLDFINTGLSLIIKAAVGSLIVLSAFLPKSLRQFFKLFLAFFSITFLFGGAMFALELTLHPKKILYLNGTVYFDMDIKYLVGCVLVIYGIFLLFDFILGKINQSKEIFGVTLLFRNTELNLKGFIDTGNALQDGITGRLVAVGELKSLSPFFTYEEIQFFKNNTFDFIPETLKGEIRFIPCKTVGESMLLPAFMPDITKINGEKIPKICVAITNKNLSDGEYNILLNQNMRKV